MQLAQQQQQRTVVRLRDENSSLVQQLQEHIARHVLSFDASMQTDGPSACNGSSLEASKSVPQSKAQQPGQHQYQQHLEALQHQQTRQVEDRCLPHRSSHESVERGLWPGVSEGLGACQLLTAAGLAAHTDRPC